MRKISKSRVDDDVVSSTNGSLLNDERASSLNNDVKEKDAGSDDGTNANTEVNDDHASDEEYNAEDTASKKSKQSKGRKRKSGKENNDKLDDSDAGNSNNDDDDDDRDSDADYGSKKTPKKSTPKSKAKKRKTGKEKVVEEEYEVDKIIDSKKIKGKLHYLIRWKGYGADSDTWEPENTLSCPDLISKFNDEKENSKAKSKEDKKPKGKKGTKRKSQRDSSRTPSKKPKNEWDSEAADENAEYEVERILEVHHKKNGKREFLIHWKGWSSKFDSWEPENNLNCSELIKKFMEKVSVAKTSESRNLRVAPETTNRFTLQAGGGGRRLSKRRGQRQRVRYDNAE